MRNNNLITKITTLAAAVAMTVGTNNAFAAPETLSANATIFNEVTVSYNAAGDTGAARTAMANVSVLVKLIESPIEISALTSISSTSTGNITNQYTLDATANGGDSYTISVDLGTNASLTPLTATFYETNSSFVGTTVLATNGSSSSLQSFGAGIALSGGATGEIYFPGGSLNGFEVGEYITIEHVANTKTVYEITGLDAGNAESSGVNENLASLTVKDLDGNAPNFAAVSAIQLIGGELIGERVYARLETDAVNTDSDNVQSVSTGLTISSGNTDGDGSNDVSVETGITGAFNNTKVLIKKRVASTLPASEFDFTAYSDSIPAVAPGSELFYIIQVTSEGAADANFVSVIDSLPAYTVLDTASIDVEFNDNGTKTVANVTPATGNTESANQVSGEVVADELIVRLGDGVDGTDGGTLISTDIVTITYKVTVN